MAFVYELLVVIIIVREVRTCTALEVFRANEELPARSFIVYAIELLGLLELHQGSTIENL